MEPQYRHQHATIITVGTLKGPLISENLLVSRALFLGPLALEFQILGNVILNISLLGVRSYDLPST